jgi:hypothetical protein
MLPFLDICCYMKKKTLGDLLACCIHCCKLKDKGGALGLLQDNNNKGDRVLPSPKYWLVLYLHEKEEEGGYDAPPLIFLWSKRQHGGHDVLPPFLATWKNKTHKDLLPPLLLPLWGEDK